MSRYSKTLPQFLIREEEEAEKFLGKIEDVNSMLSQLMSKDEQEVSDAKKGTVFHYQHRTKFTCLLAVELDSFLCRLRRLRIK